MPPRRPLPPSIAHRPFTFREAMALGIGEGRLRGPDVAHPFYGMHRAASTTARTDFEAVDAACRDYATVMLDGQYFSHLTAAWLWGCPLPSSVRPDAPLDVTTTGPQRAPRARGIRGHHAEHPHSMRRFDVPVATPSATWLGLASLLHPDDLVAVGDHLVLEPRVLDSRDVRPYATLDELSRSLCEFHGRGARNAASALRMMRQGAESRPETVLRLLLGRAELPEPELNVEIRHSGRSLGWADLYFREWRVVVEYDGEQHRTNDRQYARDMTRIEDFERAGRAVVRVRKAGLFERPDRTVARVEAALTSRGWRKPHLR